MAPQDSNGPHNPDLPHTPDKYSLDISQIADVSALDLPLPDSGATDLLLPDAAAPDTYSNDTGISCSGHHACPQFAAPIPPPRAYAPAAAGPPASAPPATAHRARPAWTPCTAWRRARHACSSQEAAVSHTPWRRCSMGSSPAICSPAVARAASWEPSARGAGCEAAASMATSEWWGRVAPAGTASVTTANIPEPAPKDCKCGDGRCAPSENGVCPADCGTCGNGKCDPWEHGSQQSWIKNHSPAVPRRLQQVRGRMVLLERGEEQLRRGLRRGLRRRRHVPLCRRGYGRGPRLPRRVGGGRHRALPGNEVPVRRITPTPGSRRCVVKSRLP